MKCVTILGSTGSIGTNTLDIIRRNPNKYKVYALVAGRNAELLSEQIAEFQPAVVVVAEDAIRVDLQERLLARNGQYQPALEVGRSAQEAVAAAPETDILISAIVGVAGLPATYAAIKAGKRVGLANKETMVTAGELVTRAVEQYRAELIPVDSEHNGAHQCMRAGDRKDVRKLILTASGGPFREMPAAAMASVTPAQALNHPTWKMGPRITIDSATLMNKGFEVIEACWLFGLPPSMVEVVVHPQSSVHAMVEYSDGSVIAQICATDMRMPIQYAMTWPDRDEAPVPRIDWQEARTWAFYPPDFTKFPLLRLAYEAQSAGGASTCILNAADEIAVEAFLKDRISFLGIASIVEETLNRVPGRVLVSVDDVLAMDREARRMAASLVAQSATTVV